MRLSLLEWFYEDLQLWIGHDRLLPLLRFKMIYILSLCEHSGLSFEVALGWNSDRTNKKKDKEMMKESCLCHWLSSYTWEAEWERGTLGKLMPIMDNQDHALHHTLGGKPRCVKDCYRRSFHDSVWLFPPLWQTGLFIWTQWQVLSICWI